MVRGRSLLAFARTQRRLTEFLAPRASATAATGTEKVLEEARQWAASHHTATVRWRRLVRLKAAIQSALESGAALSPEELRLLHMAEDLLIPRTAFDTRPEPRWWLKQYVEPFWPELARAIRVKVTKFRNQWLVETEPLDIYTVLEAVRNRFLASVKGQQFLEALERLLKRISQTSTKAGWRIVQETHQSGIGGWLLRRGEEALSVGYDLGYVRYPLEGTESCVEFHAEIRSSPPEIAEMVAKRLCRILGGPCRIEPRGKGVYWLHGEIVLPQKLHRVLAYDEAVAKLKSALLQALQS